jgi:hypothetical protein
VVEVVIEVEVEVDGDDHDRTRRRDHARAWSAHGGPIDAGPWRFLTTTDESATAVPSQVATGGPARAADHRMEVTA